MSHFLNCACARVRKERTQEAKSYDKDAIKNNQWLRDVTLSIFIRELLARNHMLSEKKHKYGQIENPQRVKTSKFQRTIINDKSKMFSALAIECTQKNVTVPLL